MPEHQSDIFVIFPVTMEILLEATSNKLLVGDVGDSIWIKLMTLEMGKNSKKNAAARKLASLMVRENNGKIVRKDGKPLRMDIHYPNYVNPKKVDTTQPVIGTTVLEGLETGNTSTLTGEHNTRVLAPNNIEDSLVSLSFENPNDVNLTDQLGNETQTVDNIWGTTEVNENHEGPNTKSFMNVVMGTKPNSKINFKTLFNEERVENADFVLPMANRKKRKNVANGVLKVNEGMRPQKHKRKYVWNMKQNQNVNAKLKASDKEFAMKIMNHFSALQDENITRHTNVSDASTSDVQAENGNDQKERRLLWHNLDVHHSMVSGILWTLLSDFNVALNIEDNLTGGSAMTSAMCEFKDYVEQIKQVVQKMKMLKKPLRKLLHSHGNLHDRVNKIRVELDAVQKALDQDPHNSTLREEEAVYLAAFIDATLDEERFLKQKAKNANNIEFTGSSVVDCFVEHYMTFLGVNEPYGVGEVVSKNQSAFIPERRISDNILITQELMHNYHFTNEEVKRVMFDIGDDKSPGPDGYSSLFFKESWDTVDGVGEVVSKNQSAFIPERRISDNILITQELMHNYHCNTRAPRCAFKVDIQKAYDTVDWKFLECILKYFSFPLVMLTWIMVCVTSASFSINVNGNMHGFFNGKCGLRQGDPLLPYLFTLVMEVLTLLLQRRVRLADFFHYHPHCESLQFINVYFANDLFMFCREELQSAELIMDALEEFKTISGLVPSIPKSRLQLCQSIISSMHVYWASVLVILVGIIHDIEQLMCGFLWCNKELKKGRAKVAWADVCLPKREGCVLSQDRCVLPQDCCVLSQDTPNGKMIVDSIENGPYVRRMIATPGEPDLPIPVPESFHEQIDEELTETDIKWMDADDQAIQTILLGLPEDVYAAVDSCETAKKIWKRVRQMMKGSDIGEQEKKAKLFNEWEKFTSTDGESIESYYHLRQTKNLHETDFTQIYYFLKMNQEEVNELRAERLAKSHDPLALMAHLQNSFNFSTTHKDQSSSSTHSQQPFQINNKYNPQPLLNQNFMQPPMTSLEDINDPTEVMNAALILFAKAFQLYAPTNNNQRTPSNPHNRQIAQPNQQGFNAWHNGGIQGAQNAGLQSGGNQNGLVVAPGIANHGETGNVVAARAEGTGNRNQARCYNCRGLGHIARNCTARPRRRDAAYLQIQLLISQKKEAGIQLQAEEFDFIAAAGDLDEIEEVNANCILIANLQ
nr:hypothetical protein [Tanacetum cinerariifolium]